MMERRKIRKRKKRERQSDKYLLQFRLRAAFTFYNIEEKNEKVFVMRAIIKEANCGTLFMSESGELWMESRWSAPDDSWKEIFHSYPIQFTYWVLMTLLFLSAGIGGVTWLSGEKRLKADARHDERAFSRETIV